MNKNSLSVYFTAGYPHLDSTLPIALSLQDAGVDFLEIGFPYSDPVADGPVIQHSSSVALENGMTLPKLFEQLQDLKNQIQIPVFLMGYFNPVMQYGVEAFCQSCKNSGVSGVIIPDLPLYEYETIYKDLFEKYEIPFVFMITPQTEDARIRRIDKLSKSFIYVLSSPSVTG
ncbi:MAG TPA: tryptophan synthase subunit alpha, partial [Sphingobacteriaceae bacterium]|nr:tryptophan synthase subunit alpha [Sphingobacteriaceae bacterium]